ncbi:MAG: isoprenylcysteine carboxylmethyltransferase family protein [Haloarculaceae archaeon]
MDESSIGTTAFTLVWVLGIFVLGVPSLIVRRTPDRLAGRGGWLRLLGVPLVVGGAGLYIWATRTLTDPGGTPAPTHEPESLVTTGPYQYARNPYYVSVLCVLLGEAALLGHIGLLAYPV